MAEGAVCKEGKQKQNHKLQIESLLDGTVGTLDGSPPPPPQQQAFGTAPREGTYGISPGRLRRGEIRTTARDITRFRLPECRVMGKSIWPTKIQDIFEIAASRAAVRCPREGLDRWLEWPVALGLSQLSNC